MTEAHYYPFGLALNGKWLTGGAEETKYRFNGIERNEDFNLNWDLADFRAYDPAIGRWNQIDPLAEYAPKWTSYRFGFDNPILYGDPFGLFESRQAAKDNAEEHGIKRGLFSGNRIRKQSDGTFAIENYKKHTSISDLGGELGVMTAVLIKPNDVIRDDSNIFTIDRETRTGDNIFDLLNGARPSIGFPGSGAVQTGVSLQGFKFLPNLKNAFGPLKNWIRGPKGSYSKTLGKKTKKTISWGASPAKNGKYVKQIGNPILRRINQWLRKKRLQPGKKHWRTGDSGHLHLDKKKPK